MLTKIGIQIYVDMHVCVILHMRKREMRKEKKGEAKNEEEEG